MEAANQGCHLAFLKDKSTPMAYFKLFAAIKWPFYHF